MFVIVLILLFGALFLGMAILPFGKARTRARNMHADDPGTAAPRPYRGPELDDD